MAGISRDDFIKSVARMEQMAKSALFHTSSDSQPGQWAGSKPEDVDEHDDLIDENGTDLNVVKKSLAAKIRKSQALTPAEVQIIDGKNPLNTVKSKRASGASLTKAEKWVLKGGLPLFDPDHKEPDGDEDLDKKSGELPSKPPSPGEQTGANGGMDTNANTDDGEIEGDAQKSFGRALGGSRTLRDGFEASGFLAEFAKAVGQGFDGVEARVARRLGALEGQVREIAKSVASGARLTAENAAFLANVGDFLAGSAEQRHGALQAPAGAPQGQMRSPQAAPQGGVIEKAFGGGNPGGGIGALTKAQVSNVMADMVTKGLAKPTDVIKYEMTNQMNPDIERAVVGYIQSAGR